MILVVLNTACAASSHDQHQNLSTQQSLSRDAKWSADIDAFAQGVKRIHPNPFHSMKEDDFNRELAVLHTKINGLTDQQLMVELMKVMATIATQRDGHSAILPYSVMPIRPYLFSDGFFIVDAPPEYRELIGARILRIAGTKIEQVQQHVAPLMTRDNSATVVARMPVFMMMPDVLRGLNLWNEGEPNLLIEKGGRTVSVDIAAISRRGLGGGLSLPPRTDSPWSKVSLSKEQPRVRKSHFFQELLSPEVLYIQYNVVSAVNPEGGETIEEFSQRIREVVVNSRVAKVIVDVRHNSGGNNTTYGPLLDALSTEEINRHGKLYLLTSRATFSAAGNFVTELEKNTRVILVGEPSGGSPNQYGDSRQVKLPYATSMFLVGISSRYHQQGVPGEERLIHAVDLPVSLSSADYFSGQDAILNAALQDIGSPLVRERHRR